LSPPDWHDALALAMEDWAAARAQGARER